MQPGIAGVVFAVASVLIFLIDVPELRQFLPALRAAVVVLWALRITSATAETRLR